MSKKFIFLAFFATFTTLCLAKSQYFVATPRIIRTGEDAKIAVTFTDITQDVTVSVELFDEKNDSYGTVGKVFPYNQQMTTKTGIVEFYIPPKLKSNIAIFEVRATGGVTFTKTLKVAVEKVSEKIFIQTDKPIYKPGETIKFRVIGIDRFLLPVNNRKISEISITNSGGSRIMQWLDVMFQNGMTSIEFPISKKPVMGTWKITVVFNGKKTSQNVQVEKYVLPKFEVTAKTEPYILKRATSIPVTICAKYTYGKNVEGTLDAKICLDASYGWLRNRLRRSCNLLKKLKIKGCTVVDFDVSGMELLQRYYYYQNIVVKVDAKVTEAATGVTLNGTHTSVPLSKQDVKLDIELNNKYYKPGFPMTAKVKASTPDGRPTESTVISLTLFENYQKVWNKNVVVTNGVYTLTHKTTDDSKSVRIEAVYNPEIQQQDHHKQNVRKYMSKSKIRPRPYNPYGRYNVRTSVYTYPWFSKVKKYLKIMDVSSFEVGKNVEIEIESNSFDEKTTINHVLVCNGKIVKALNQIFDSTKHILSFRVTEEMTPTCRFLTFINYKGELIADYKMLKTNTLELKNKASIKFNKDSSMPGEKVRITLKAEPDSRFALSAVDRSVQLLGETNDIRESQVLSVLKALDVDRGNLQRRSCNNRYSFWGGGSRNSNGADGFMAISETGLVYFSDLDTDIVPCPPPIYPDFDMVDEALPMAAAGGANRRLPVMRFKSANSGKQKMKPVKANPVKNENEKKVATKTRTNFPETWLWNDGTLEYKVF